MSDFYNDQHFSNLDCAETVASALFPDLTTSYSNDLIYQYPVTIPPIVTNPSNPSGKYGYDSQPSRSYFDEFSNTPSQSSDLTATYRNDLPDQYSVTFPSIVSNSSYPSGQYGSNFQSSTPPFDDHWNTPNEFSDLTATYSNDLPDQYPVTFPPIVTDSSYPSLEYASNFQSSSFDESNTPCQSSESPQNNQQFSTSCSSNSSFLAPSPTPSIATSVASEDSMPNLDFYPPEEPSMISLWKKLTMPGKNLFIRIFNSLELDDDKKREYLERMDIQEEVKAHMDSSEEIEKQMDDQTTFVLNLDARPPAGTTLNTADLLFRNEENRRNLTYKGKSLAQQMFATLVLRRTQWHYSRLLKKKKPWQSLMKSGKKSYVRIFNWLNLDDDKKRKYLEIMEIQMKLKQHMNPSEEIAKQMDDQTTFIPNLDARPPVGTTMNTIDLIIQNEKNRRNFFYKRRCLTPPMFSTLVLRKSQCLYARLLKNTKSWEALTEPRRKPYVRIYNWLKLDDNKKREYLDFMEIEEEFESQMDSSEKIPKQKKSRTKFSEVETEAEPMEPLVKQQATTASSAPAHLPSSAIILSPSSVSSDTSLINLDASLPIGISINTADILDACESSRRRFEFNGKILSRMTFSELVLERSHYHYSRICKNRKPWESMSVMGKALHVRIYNWVQLTDEGKRKYLEMMRNRKKKTHQSHFPNLDIFPPKGSSMISLWKKLTIPEKNLFTLIFNSLEVDDDRKREYLKIMEIEEEVNACMDSSERIEKQNKVQTASIPNLDALPPVETTMVTSDLLSRNEENRRNLTYKGMPLTRQMFATLVLRRTGWHYTFLLNRRKSWQSLVESGKKIYIRIFNWLKLVDDKKREYLEIMEIQMKLEKHMDSIEYQRKNCKCMQKKCRANFSRVEIEAVPSTSFSVPSSTSLINLDASLPTGISINTADILDACESSRRQFEFNGKILSRMTFSELVLERNHYYYSSICKNPQPWKFLAKKGKSLFVRIYNWIQLKKEDKRTYLETMEKMKEKPATSEKKKTLTKCTESQQKMKRKRGAKTKFTEYQEKALKTVYQMCNYPTMLFRRNLAKELDLPFAVVQNYFFNHRYRK